MNSEDQVVEVFNTLFVNIVPNLKIPANQNYDIDFIVTNDQVVIALHKYTNHSSTVIIKKKRKIDQCFSLGLVTYDDILKKR